MEFGAAGRVHFSLPADCAFLNHGSFGLVPRQVAAVAQQHRDRLESQPVAFFADLPEELSQVRARVAAFLGADSAGLVLVDNATTGVAAVLNAVPVRPGQALVTTSYVYGAVRAALRFRAAATGASVVEVPLPFPLPEEEDEVSRVEAALGPEVALLVVDHLASRPACALAVPALVRAARRAGVPVLVDAAHAPGQVPVDLSEDPPDFWVGNLHKWAFAPRGSAALWVGPAWRDRVHPPVISHGLGQGLAAEFDWLGTRDPSPWLAVPAALAFWERAAQAGLWTWQAQLRAAGSALLREGLGVGRSAPDHRLAAMEAVELPGFPPDEASTDRLRRRLWGHHRVEAPVYPHQGRAWVRTSAQLYNERADYERLLRALRQEGIQPR